MLPKAIVAVVVSLGPLAAAPGPPDFAREVQPILAARCLGCHGSKMQMAGLRLDQGAAALAGSASGPVIVRGQSAASKLFQRVSSEKPGFRMPPSGDRLTPQKIAILKSWIDGGAAWPGSDQPLTATQPTSSLWSLQPIRRPDPPLVRARQWVRNPIDHFVLAKLESRSIEPSPEADRRTLVRRVTLDLTGLPPTPDEIRQVLADNRADWYERMVDRLLASPHYGERWARNWLDLARYGDSDGYEKDLTRPNAWRWRQWVIDARNADMPFDEFTIEQLAGDLLPRATVEQRVATGFQRNTLTNREAGVDRAEARFEQIVNRTNTVSTVWLGMTIGCAQCHNHKYDPLTQRDHYRLQAFWNATDETTIDAPLPGEMGAYLRALPAYRQNVDALLHLFQVQKRMAQWTTKMREAFREQGKDLEWDFQVTQFRAMIDGADKFLRGEPEADEPKMRDRLIRYYVSSPGPEADQAARDEFRKLRQEWAALDARMPVLSQADVLAAPRVPAKTWVHPGGDYRAQSDEVEAGVPAILPQLPAGENSRLGLARWLVGRENPLTARVTVNRMWQEFFGRGIVRTSEDFGTQGDAPTHPELLDWLASEFRDNGWSMKRMHRLMVTSATYRQSSHARPAVDTRDPENTWLSHQSRVRMPAESVRDAALSAAGLLDFTVGGHSVKPPQPKGIAELVYAGSARWVESQGGDRYRRGLYIHFQRTAPYPMLMNFDAPDSNVSCTRRRRSNTPLQALNLLNDPVFHEAAQALAVRLYREMPDSTFDERLDRAWMLTVGRTPSSRERARLAQYFEQQKGMLKAEKSAGEMLPFPPDGVAREEAAAWVGIARVLMNLDEFVNRE